MRRQLIVDALIALLLAAAVWTLYHKVTNLWLTLDDAYTIHLVVDHGLSAFFWDSSVWPQKLYTPLLLIVTEGELAAFGLEIARWYLAQLAMITASAIALYALLRRYFDQPAAAAASLMFVAAVSLCSLTMALSGVHYFVAIVFGAVAVNVYITALRRDRFSLAVLSALLYVFAMLAKETVVPLAVLLVVLPDRTWRTRGRFAIPHAVALIGYFALRRAVIGTFAGGYGWAVLPSEWPHLIALLPFHLVLAMGGVALVSLIAIGALPALRNRQAIVLFVVAMVLAVGPIVPVSKVMQPRFALMPWLVLSIAFVAGVSTLKRRAIVIALLVVAPLATIAANRREWREEFNLTRRMSDEARFFFYDMPANGLLRAPSVPPAAMGELDWLKTIYAHRQAGASWFYDDFFLCSVGTSGKRTWQYDAPNRSLVEITSSVSQSSARFCGGIRASAPLAVAFHYRGETLLWHFGPYRDGEFRLLRANGQQAFDVLPDDAFRLGGLPGISLRVEYRSPAGWVTYSPDFALDFVHHPDVIWRR
jgi:hypothetical protein